MTTVTIDDLLALAKGNYQESLIYGNETWSGSSLKGKARSYSASYFKSRKTLLARIEKSQLGYLTQSKNGIVLVHGRPPGHYVGKSCSLGTMWIPGEKTILDDILDAVDEVENRPS